MGDNKDNFTLFRGTKVNKTQANRIGVGIVFGLIGIVLILLLPFKELKFLNYTILFLCVMFGYFIVGPKIFK